MIAMEREMELACAESKTVLEQLKQLSQYINENERMLGSLCYNLGCIVNGKPVRADGCDTTECASKELSPEVGLREQIESIQLASRRIEKQLIGLEKTIRSIG